MNSKILGGILLIVGTSIGAGMLGLPVVTAAGGYFHSIWLFLMIWLATMFAAFLILEVNLWLPENTNLISMARQTLGPVGELFTWIIYLLLLYSLLSAYSAGGADLLHGLFQWLGINIPISIDTIVFITILGAIVYFGIQTVDWANRGLMFVKMGAYLFLVLFVVPHVHVPALKGGQFYFLSSAMMVVVTSFGYATIIPSLRTYFKSDVKALRLTILAGSLISLICYLLWDFAVQGSLGSGESAKGLLAMSHSDHTASDLTTALSTQLHSRTISNLAHTFTSICITTSFLGVSLCLFDFLKDGFRLQGKQQKKSIIFLLTFLPPLLVVLFFPSAFLIGLNYAGICCAILLILLPALMAFSGRYIYKYQGHYQVCGGKTAIVIEILIALLVLIYGIMQLK